MSSPSNRSRPVVVLSIITRLARGGSERRLFDAVGAVEAEHVVVVGRDSPDDAVEALAGRAEVLRCDDLTRAVDPSRDARALIRLARLVRSRRADVVHTHQSKAGLLGRLATVGVTGPDRPVVYHSASMASFGPGYGRAESTAFALAERATAPLVDRYFAVGDDLARRLRGNGVPPAKLDVVRSSLDLAAFVPPSTDGRVALRRRFGVDPDGPVVAFVGSLDERKGVGRLPVVVERATAGVGGPIGVLVAGAGPFREALGDRLGAVPGVEARLLGHVPFVAEVMQAADVLVLPSSAEGLPQVVVQAAACGLPVVAYDVDGVREMATLGAEVGIAPLGDEDALVDALRGGLVVSTDRARRRSLPDDVLKDWDPVVVADHYRAAYGVDLAGRHRRPRA